MDQNSENPWGLPHGSDKSEQLLNHLHRRSEDPTEMVGYLHRRVDDCEKHVLQMKTDIIDLKSQQALLANEFIQLNHNIGRMAEIMEAWNNAKGFWSVMRFMTAFAKVTVTAGFLAAAIWIFMKTGHWIKLDE